MVAILLVAVPAALGGVCFLLRWSAASRVLLVSGAAAHGALTAWAWRLRSMPPAAASWIGLDPLGLLFLSVTSVLFVAASVYAAGFLAREGRGDHADPEEGFLFRNYPHGAFSGCLLLLLSALTLVALSRQFGLLWVAVEATTLVSATLIHYHRHHRSLEASWKYLLICSVGIALALLGNFFLAAAAAGAGEEGSGLSFAGLIQRAPLLDKRWLRAAAVLFVVGYGTKMGLVPMHTWLPDAHSEAPSAVSALLSGALLNGAFLALLRMQGLLSAAGLEGFGRGLLLALGFVSMAGAALFIVAQKDYKRMLAYSSVENMGILAVGVGLGGAGDWGALYHVVNHSLIKAALFFTAGNILLAYQTKRVDEARGVLRVLPISGALWLAGLVAIAGFPPFGSFLSELSILRAAISGGRYVAAGAFLLLLLGAFAGLAASFSRMAHGQPPQARARVPEGALTVVPPLALLAGAALLGVVVPRFLDSLIVRAVGLVAGTP